MIPEPIQTFLHQLEHTAPASYADLRAVFFNGTLKKSPERSHTDGLIAISGGILRRLGVHVDVVRTVDHDIPSGVWPDMREHGFAADEFPDIYHRLVEPANILVLAGPLWLGDNSSHTRAIVERLYAYSGDLNDRGQWAYYGKAGGALITGNEDGGKHATSSLLYALQHIGLTVPPQSDAYWVGEAGPGPSYLDDPGGGVHNSWTTRNTVFMTWNLLHTARWLKDAGGFPAHGNLATQWDTTQPVHPNPEYR